MTASTACGTFSPLDSRSALQDRQGGDFDIAGSTRHLASPSPLSRRGKCQDIQSPHAKRPCWLPRPDAVKASQAKKQLSRCSQACLGCSSDVRVTDATDYSRQLSTTYLCSGADAALMLLGNRTMS
ncbi:hypothetical protein XA68_15406 [Ophiocordyceps unilateralis]|uniref:Uncharacterized protein n=1 Tax=Ophiocordyceps unilateralis TaxID=268505 RepID=A0A2A9P8A0_OPHUN|nr:hypothetical protein XA68_15406 [Ophiocordyceps unilateralis]